MKKTNKLREDLLMVRETLFSTAKTPLLKFKNFDSLFLASMEKKNCGVLITVSNTLSFTLIQEIADPQGLVLVCNIDLTTYTLVNVYAPNTKRLLIGGDFNTVGDLALDSSLKKCLNHQAPT